MKNALIALTLLTCSPVFAAEPLLSSTIDIPEKKLFTQTEVITQSNDKDFLIRYAKNTMKDSDCSGKYTFELILQEEVGQWKMHMIETCILPEEPTE